MIIVELTTSEIMYLENTLRMVQGTGQPIGLREGENLAQSLLDKLESVEFPSKERAVEQIHRFDQTQGDSVPVGYACPCGEARVDYLEWNEEGDKVTCQTCKTTYEPGVFRPD